MRILMVAASLLCCSCVSFLYNLNSDFSTRGIYVHDNQGDTYMAEDEMEHLIAYALEQVGYEDIFEGWNMVFMSAWIGIPEVQGQMGVADGYTNLLDRVMYLRVRPSCYSDSAIIHEMGHVIEFFKKGLKDIRHQHKDRDFWDKNESYNKNMVNELCPEGYERPKEKVSLR